MGYGVQKYAAMVAPLLRTANDNDRELLQAAVWQPWEDITPEWADSAEVRGMLARIEREKYRADRASWEASTVRMDFGDDFGDDCTDNNY